MKIVADTNILISALLSARGSPAEIIRLERQGEFASAVRKTDQHGLLLNSLICPSTYAVSAFLTTNVPGDYFLCDLRVARPNGFDNPGANTNAHPCPSTTHCPPRFPPTPNKRPSPPVTGRPSSCVRGCANADARSFYPRVRYGRSCDRLWEFCDDYGSLWNSVARNSTWEATAACANAHGLDRC